MKGLVELTESETRDVKGGTEMVLVAIVNGVFSVIRWLLPGVKSFLGNVFNL
ncbi:MAG: hypothetical protein LBT59_03095 [Clostridiales bacterium]|jgi:hypothetical protein|nr:hypothetical protein [Clostridiales bacterium]